MTTTTADGRSADMSPGYYTGDDYDVHVHCRNYLPAGGAGIMRMDDYSMCGSCRHRRRDERCGLAEKTLA